VYNDYSAYIIISILVEIISILVEIILFNHRIVFKFRFYFYYFFAKNAFYLYIVYKSILHIILEWKYVYWNM